MLRIAVLVTATLLFMMMAHPARVPALMLVVPFAAIFVCLYLILLEILRFFRPESEEPATAPRAVTVAYRPRLLAALVAGFPVLLLVLQSIMELNVWDVLIASGIFVLAYVVVSRGTFSLGR